MKTVAKMDVRESNLEKEYSDFLLKLDEAINANQKVIYLEELSYKLHLRLSDENYTIRKIIKTTSIFWFITKRRKFYCVLL
jgi:hypothetical protein